MFTSKYSTLSRPHQQWELHKVITPKLLIILLLLCIVLSFSARNTELTAAIETAKAMIATTGLTESRVLDSGTVFKRRPAVYFFESSESGDPYPKLR